MARIKIKGNVCNAGFLKKHCSNYSAKKSFAQFCPLSCKILSFTHDRDLSCQWHSVNTWRWTKELFLVPIPYPYLPFCTVPLVLSFNLPKPQTKSYIMQHIANQPASLFQTLSRAWHASHALSLPGNVKDSLALVEQTGKHKHRQHAHAHLRVQRGEVMQWHCDVC